MTQTGDKRVVLVTGAGKGLGRAFALACAAQGDAVVVNNRRRAGEPSSADAVVEEIRALGGTAIAEYSDIAREGASGAVAQAVEDGFGRLDAVILNAGIRGEAARFENTSAKAFRDVFEINFFANVALVRTLLPLIEASPAGRIVCIASSSGLYGLGGFTPYSASKGALTAFALAMAQEQARRGGVGVNVLAPYAVTNMTAGAMPPDLEAAMTAEAAAEPAAWLSSQACEAAGRIWVAGGRWMRRAGIVEARGEGPADEEDMNADWIGARLDRLDDLYGGAAFEGAEPAFIDFAKAALKRS